MTVAYRCTPRRLLSGFRDWRVEKEAQRRLYVPGQSPEDRARDVSAAVKAKNMVLTLGLIAVLALSVGPFLNTAGVAFAKGAYGGSVVDVIVNRLVWLLFVIVAVSMLFSLYKWATRKMGQVRRTFRLVQELCRRGFEIEVGLRQPYTALT